ncbi:unnamed protein product, partial [Amoebophrya sp. A120]|eukprot:GSA120T00005537001.1
MKALSYAATESISMRSRAAASFIGRRGEGRRHKGAHQARSPRGLCYWSEIGRPGWDVAGATKAPGSPMRAYGGRLKGEAIAGPGHHLEGGEGCTRSLANGGGRSAELGAACLRSELRCCGGCYQGGPRPGADKRTPSRSSEGRRVGSPESCGPDAPERTGAAGSWAQSLSAEQFAAVKRGSSPRMHSRRASAPPAPPVCVPAQNEAKKTGAIVGGGEEGRQRRPGETGDHSRAQCPEAGALPSA